MSACTFRRLTVSHRTLLRFQAEQTVMNFDAPHVRWSPHFYSALMLLAAIAVLARLLGRSEA